MDALLQDLRLALRGLVRAPGFTVLTASTLALGIGANAAIFSVVNALLLRGLPYENADRIVMLSERSATDPERQGSTSWLNFADWQGQAASFDAMAVSYRWQPSLTGLGEAERLSATIVTAGIMDVFGIVPQLGRPMLAADNDPAAATVVLVSDGFWRRRLGADPAAIGRTITLNAAPAEIIGVLPQGFEPPGELRGELWANGALDPRDTRGSRYVRVMARLAPGVTLAAARAEMATISARLAEAYPRTNAGMLAVVRPLRDTMVGDAARPLVLLLGAAVLVLFIACANLSSLLIVRNVARARDVAVHAALGAARRRTMRQLFLEAVLIAAAGGAAGCLLAVWGAAGLVAAGPEVLRVQPVAVDFRVVAFALGITALTATLAGLLPSLRSSRADLGTLLKEGSRATGGRASGRLRAAMTVGQLALALALLCGAGLLVKSFARVHQVEAGIDPERLLVMSFNLPRVRYDSARSTPFLARVREQVAALPGVRATAVTSIVPFGGDWDRIVVDVEGRIAPDGQRPEGDRYIVTPDYHAAMGIPLREGRLLSSGDRYAAPLVCLVDEVFARQLAPGGSAVGLRLRLPGRDSFATVVGVVGHVKHYGLEASSQGQVYMAEEQYPWRFNNLVVRTAGDPLAGAAAVRGLIRTLDPDLPLFDVTSLEHLMGERTASRRFVTLLLALFAGAAALLAGLGLYGVIAFGVQLRRREIGVRLALGAQRRQIARLVIGQGVRLAVPGLALGLLCAVALTRLLAGLLFGVAATDAGVFAAVAVLLGLVTLLASWLPARRAVRVDPLIAIRSE